LLQASVGVVVAGAVWQRDCVRRKEKKATAVAKAGEQKGKKQGVVVIRRIVQREREATGGGVGRRWRTATGRQRREGDARRRLYDGGEGRRRREGGR